ncbi:MAG: Ni,Fe-hydrogenase III large subunit, partial [Betaproteobacteria bacterium]|nr:Ni,Fe-hydrogenase III large subunit [Betaproteobacteria bacterium]
WSRDWHPLRADAGALREAGQAEPYAYVEVQGQGVHEINVGPVHAGIIEPGQFRFSLLGEKVLRLEQRLGWTHKGVARLFRGRDAAAAVRLAARLSGDSTVAGAWACCMALEEAAGVRVPPRARQLRALLLERERIANHLGDIGAIAGDTGLGFGLSQFSMLKEQVLRLNQQLFGARWPMDALCPGGLARDIEGSSLGALDMQCLRLADDARVLLAAFDQHAGLQDRLRATGCVLPELARSLGMLGLAARASAQDLDLRRDMPLYAAHGLRVPLQTAGDVAARMAQRFEELFESLRLCRELLLSLPGGEVLAPWPQSPAAPAACWSLGLVEGWRGPVLVALRLDGDGRVAQAHAHDPSWQNWPAVEQAAARDIIADFPLINKSFNLSYSGHDA